MCNNYSKRRVAQSIVEAFFHSIRIKGKSLIGDRGFLDLPA